MLNRESKEYNARRISAWTAKLPVGATLSHSSNDISALLASGESDGHLKMPSPSRGIIEDACEKMTRELRGHSTQRRYSSSQGQNARDRALQSIAKRNRQCAHYVQKELDAGLKNSLFVDNKNISPHRIHKNGGVSNSPCLSDSSFFVNESSSVDGSSSSSVDESFFVDDTLASKINDKEPSSNITKKSAAASSNYEFHSTSRAKTSPASENSREWQENFPLNSSNSNDSTHNKMSVVTNASLRVSSDPEEKSCRKPLAVLRNKNKIKSPDTLPLSVQREKGRKMDDNVIKHHAEQETRRNLDKRSARLQYSECFKQDVRRFLKLQASQKQKVASGTAVLSTETNSYIQNIYSSEKVAAAGGVAVFVRKRPIFQYELERNDFDVVSLASDESDASLGLLGTAARVQIQNCHMHADMRRMMVTPIEFTPTLAFDETCSNNFVYNTVAYPLVQNVTSKGGISTILMFGQTGSGKTYTMSSIELHAANDLFAALDENWNSRGAPEERQYAVTLQFIELAGKICRDLITSCPNEKSSVKIVDDNGCTKIRNAQKILVKSAQELSEWIALGKSRRATEATDANGVSSRSHSVCQIEVRMTRKDGGKRRGVLNLLDCAGTERRNDTLYHSSSRQKESTEINESLYALKACIRARTKSGSRKAHVPYRSSNLTKLLRESFERHDAKLGIIATISPNATDTEHSIETLKTVASFSDIECFQSGEPRFVEVAKPKLASFDISPKQMSHSQLVRWLAKSKFPHAGVGSSIDGKAFFRMSEKMLCSQCFDGNAKVAEEVFKKLRLENDRVSQLQRDARKAFKETRRSKLH